jgi:hypothetical protein
MSAVDKTFRSTNTRTIVTLLTVEMKVPCITQNTSFSEVGPQVMIHNPANWK